ncbi:MAG: FmdB family zinc ribbon protein [Solirubrobacteraceae bacterium]
MPIYEYRRPDGSTFEMIQSFSEEPLTHDPETGVEVTRVLHAPAVHFKGSGFYNTDYGTRRRQRESANAESSGDSGGSGDAKEAGSGKESAGKDSSAKDGSSSKDGSSKPKAKSEKVSAS